MTGNPFGDFLHRMDTIAGLLSDRVAGELAAMSRVLNELRSVPEVDFVKSYAAEDGEISLQALSNRNERLAVAIANAVSSDSTTDSTDDATKRLLSQLHSHTLDAVEVLEQAGDNAPAFTKAMATAKSLEQSAAMLVGFREAFEAGQQSTQEVSTPPRTPSVRPNKGRQR